MGSLPANTGAQIVLIDPENPKRVYAANEMTMYRSDDGGQTWQAVAGGLPDGGIVALALDPREPQRLYAANAAGELYLSEDGTSSWRALPGETASAR